MSRKNKNCDSGATTKDYNDIWNWIFFNKKKSNPDSVTCTCKKKSKWQTDNGVCIKCGKPFLSY